MQSSRHIVSDSVFGPCEDPEANFEIDASAQKPAPANLSSEKIAPFLVKHIPGQYAPLGYQPDRSSGHSSANSKYCYRHRPDLKCRRQADEASMEKLQEVCILDYCQSEESYEANEDGTIRTLKHFLKVTNKGLPIFGRFSRQLLPNIEHSYFEEFWSNAVFRNFRSCRLPCAN